MSVAEIDLVELLRAAASLNMEVRISPAGGIIMRPARAVSRPAPASAPAEPDDSEADAVTGNAARCRRYRAARKPCRTMSPPPAPPMSPGMSDHVGDHVAGMSEPCRDMGGDMVSSPPLPPPPSLSPAPPIPPAPTHTPTQAHTPPADADTCEGDGIPPVTLDQAKSMAGQHGSTPEIAEKWWLDQDARGWLDGRGILIARPWSSLRSYTIAWQANAAKDAARAKAGGSRSRPEEGVSTTDRVPNYPF